MNRSLLFNDSIKFLLLYFLLKRILSTERMIWMKRQVKTDRFLEEVQRTSIHDHAEPQNRKALAVVKVEKDGVGHIFCRKMMTTIT